MKYPCQEEAKNESFPLFLPFLEMTCNGLKTRPLQVEGKGADRLDPRIPGSLRLGRGAAMWLMPGARSKRCRQARPLTGVGRLAERERPACGCVHQCRTRSLSARSAHPLLSRAASPALLARTNVGMAVERYVRMGSGAIPLDEHSRT